MTAAGLYAPHGAELVLEWTDPITKTTIVKATIFQPLAKGGLNPPLQTYKQTNKQSREQSNRIDSVHAAS